MPSSLFANLASTSWESGQLLKARLFVAIVLNVALAICSSDLFVLTSVSNSRLHIFLY